MTAASYQSLVSSLSALDVRCERTTAEEFEATLEPLLRDPAVGVPLSEFDVSLADTDVTVDPTPAALASARTGVTPAAYAIAEYGSLVLPSSASGSELVSLYVDRHVAVVREDDIVPTMDAAFDQFGDDFREQAGSDIIATGPSATADMGALVHGAHGPSEVHVVVLEGER